MLPDVVVAEMFLLESKPGTSCSLLDNYGPTLVLHNIAYNFDKSKRDRSKAWSRKDFWGLINYAKPCERLNLKQLIYKLVSCNVGESLPIIDSKITITLSDSDKKIEIPSTRSRFNEMAPSLCEQLGISTFVLLYAN